VTTYRGGRWYDGRAFVPRDVAVGPGDDVVDLDGGWVVPPFGEQHTHWLEPGLLDTYVAEHQRVGVLYVRDLCCVPRPPVEGIAMHVANAGFTSPGGHPVPLFAALGVDPETATHQVASEADVDRVWDAHVATRPDVVKVFLGPRGLDPGVAAYVARRAAAHGLPVAAHVENANDVHVAVAIGAAELAHLPFAPPYEIADRDLAPLTVSTTTQWLDEEPEHVEVTRRNVERLRRAGATVTVGTDLLRVTADVEAERLLRLGILDAPALLRAWCVDTCAALRRHDDLLVLGGDPLADWSHTRDVRLRVRAGVALTPGPARFPETAPG
jgi:imidazolonepropionase-like amidohydrolase